MQHPRRRVRRREKRGAATGVSEVRFVPRRRGKTTPTLIVRDEVTRRRRIRRSGLGRRETSGPRNRLVEPKTPRGPPRRESGERETGSARGAGERDSSGWQTSVERIARPLRRSGRKTRWRRRRLAWKKSVAPSDAGRGRTEGETVRAARGFGPPSAPHAARSGSSSTAPRYDVRRLRVLARLPSPAGRKLGSSARRSTPHRRAPAARSGHRYGAADRADSESSSGVPTGDDEDVRGRRDSVKALQGPKKTAEGPASPALR